MREREEEGEVEGSNLIGKTGEGEERRRKGHGTRVTGWNSFRGKASDSGGVHPSRERNDRRLRAVR